MNKDIIIATLVGEASVDGINGMMAIHSVIRNRAAHSGKSLEEICLEPKQFSMWNGSTPQSRQKIISDFKNAQGGMWQKAAQVANSAHADITMGSTHYYLKSIKPYWASGKNPCYREVTQIGSHYFGIDFSVEWIDLSKLPAYIINKFKENGKEPLRCYVDNPKRFPPKLV